MIIKIYLDKDRKATQVITPVNTPKCSIESIVSAVTRGNYDSYEVSGNHN